VTDTSTNGSTEDMEDATARRLATALISLIEDTRFRVKAQGHSAVAAMVTEHVGRAPVNLHLAAARLPDMLDPAERHGRCQLAPVDRTTLDEPALLAALDESSNQRNSLARGAIGGQ
jgi:hypothetical protein